MERCGRRENGNVLAGLKCKQVRVAGDDEIGGCRESARKHMIVIRIARNAGNLGGFHQLDRLEVIRDSLLRCLADSGEASGHGRAGNHVGELFEEHRAAVDVE